MKPLHISFLNDTDKQNNGYYINIGDGYIQVLELNKNGWNEWILFKWSFHNYLIFAVEIAALGGLWPLCEVVLT